MTSDNVDAIFHAAGFGPALQREEVAMIDLDELDADIREFLARERSADGQPYKRPTPFGKTQPET